MSDVKGEYPMTYRLDHVRPGPNTDYEVWCERCDTQIGAYTAAVLADPDVLGNDLRRHGAQCGWRKRFAVRLRRWLRIPRP